MGGERAGRVRMPQRPAGYLLNSAVCMRDADAKVMIIILETRSSFASRRITGRTNAKTAAEYQHGAGVLIRCGRKSTMSSARLNKKGDVWDFLRTRLA